MHNAAEQRPTTIDQRVRALVTEDTGHGPWSMVGRHPAIPDDLTEWERDLADWGLALGMAIALARGEDPYEHLISVCHRGYDAARAAFESTHRGFTASREVGAGGENAPRR